MDRPKVSLPPSRPPGPRREVIPPYQVWMTLTLPQQHHFRQTLVGICQELVATVAIGARKEVRDD